MHFDFEQKISIFINIYIYNTDNKNKKRININDRRFCKYCSCKNLKILVQLGVEININKSK